LQRKLRLEISHLNRQINAIQREEEKVKREIKVAAKKGDRDVCVVLAKSIVHSKKVFFGRTKGESKNLKVCCQTSCNFSSN